MPSKTKIKKQSVAEQRKLCGSLSLPKEGEKKSVVHRLFNCYNIPLTPVKAADGESEENLDSGRSVTELEEELGLTKETVAELKKAGLTNVARLVRLAKSKMCPDNFRDLARSPQ